MFRHATERFNEVYHAAIRSLPNLVQLLTHLDEVRHHRRVWDTICPDEERARTGRPA